MSRTVKNPYISSSCNIAVYLGQSIYIYADTIHGVTYYYTPSGYLGKVAKHYVAKHMCIETVVLPLQGMSGCHQNRTF